MHVVTRAVSVTAAGRVVIDRRAAEGAVDHVLHGHHVRAGAILCMEITGALPFATRGMTV